MKNNLIVFCHGVGTFTKGRLPKESTLINDVKHTKVEDFCWSEIVPNPFHLWGSFDLDYLSSFGWALHGSAWLGFDQYNSLSAIKKITLSISNFFAFLTYVLVGNI